MFHKSIGCVICFLQSPSPRKHVQPKRLKTAEKTCSKQILKYFQIGCFQLHLCYDELLAKNRHSSLFRHFLEFTKTIWLEILHEQHLYRVSMSGNTAANVTGFFCAKCTIFDGLAQIFLASCAQRHTKNRLSGTHEHMKKRRFCAP